MTTAKIETVPGQNGADSDSYFTAPTRAEFMDSVRRHVRYSLGRNWAVLSSLQALHAVSLAARDLMIDRLLVTEEHIREADAKRIYYLSMEFLVGRSLGNNLTNLGIFEIASEVLQELGFSMEDLREEEVDAALGNGGLGRLAACFLDSMATLDIPGFGYGINYEYGIFKQEIDNGFQVERPDNWRSHYSPWLFERPLESVTIPIYGNLAHGHDRDGNVIPNWVDCRYIVGLPSDMPIIGYDGRTCNYLRLYSARASHEFDIIKFNEGNYTKAVEDKIATENISKVLYPSDANEAGRELRLLQEYFFVACAVRDIVRKYLRKRATFNEFPDKVAIQMNDTHPALAVAELMRMFVDEHRVPWDTAWDITVRTLGFTNHTLLPEALEKWPEPLIHKMLPRHLMVIHEINRRFLDTVTVRFPDEPGRQASMSIIEESNGHKQVRMAHLAIIGSHAINGVANLHSELVKSQLVPEFHDMYPERFSNKTNGVTPRRWLLKANPGLSDMITGAIGDGWITQLDQLRGLEPFADDPAFREQFLAVKRANKLKLAKVIKEKTGTAVDPDSLVDVICKRIHEYKRQLLMAMRAIHEYLCLVEDRREPTAPRTYVFAGKAAPGYWAAKQIIKLVGDIARVVNNDPRVRDRMRVVFLPDYRVSLAEKMIPAADISEQISTAGKEASGTGNMKFSMNGALTVCTYDGANIEIIDHVGEENIFVFGLRAEEVRRMRETNSYNPWDIYQRSSAVKRVMDVFNSSKMFGRDSQMFQWIFHSLVQQGDPYFHLADFDAYLDAQERASQLYLQPEEWSRKAVLNVARMGWFSSDRTIREYADDIWGVKSLYD